jgi:hypothetical protein
MVLVEMTTRPFKIINKKNGIARGTSFQGCVRTTYDKLVSLLGDPLPGSSDGKTTCEWILEFEDNTIATIYDWKLSSTPKDLYDWHIGGVSLKALDYVEEALNISTKISKF